MSKSVDTIIFGGGCFWCVEAVMQMLRGVKKVTSGYAGGTLPNPTYQDVSSGTTGHAEVIQIDYDPSVVALDDLLAVFFSSHDPTALNRQGNDVGTQYRSVIFYTKPEQKPVIEAYIQKLTADKTFPKDIVTTVEPLTTFYPAEDYHQNYYRNNSTQPYCQFTIDPKIAKLRQQYAHLLHTS